MYINWVKNLGVLETGRETWAMNYSCYVHKVGVQNQKEKKHIFSRYGMAK